MAHDFKNGVFEPIHFKHDVKYYVPVWQKNPDGSRDDFPGYPTFSYSLSLATIDEQMAWSFNPDYVLELTGKFDATTKAWNREDTMPPASRL